MAYRNDIDALEARYRALDAELAERTRERDEAGRLLEEARTRAMHDEVIADLAAGGPARRRRERAIVATLITGVAIAIGAVGYKLAEPSRPRRTDHLLLLQLSKFSDQMCTCPDRACAMEVSDQMVRWSEEQARDLEPPARIDEMTTRRATVLAQHLAECMQRAMAEGPTYPLPE